MAEAGSSAGGGSGGHDGSSSSSSSFAKPLKDASGIVRESIGLGKESTHVSFIDNSRLGRKE